MDLSRLSAENKQLVLELLQKGRNDDAFAVLNAYGATRTQGTLGERGDILARGRELGMTREDLFVPEESQGSKFLADMGAGFVSQGLGAQQLLRHATPGMDTEDIDQRVLDARKQYKESGLADEVTGGNLLANIIPAAGAGLLVRGAIAASPLLGSAGLGAFEESYQPVETGNYWTEKGINVGIGAGLGLATEGVPAASIRGTELLAEAPGDIYRAAMHGSYGTRPGNQPGWFRGPEGLVDENLRMGAEMGIDFTPGQVTQAGGTKQLEETSRTNIFTENRVERSDDARATQYEDYLRGFVSSLGPNAPIETVARKVQSWGRERADELIEARRVQADADYSPVQQWADGEPLIEADNYRMELMKIIRQGQGAGASEDQIRAAAQAVKRYDRLEAQGGLLSGADIEMLTRAQDAQFTGSPFDTKDPEFGQVLAGRLARATMDDAMKVPALHAQLTRAKRNYAIASDHIDEFENSVVGQVLGKEFMSEVDGTMSNTKSPEALMQKFRTESPTRITAAMAHMDKVDPALANEFRASFLERAREAAYVRSVSGGPSGDFKVGDFLRNLGITGSAEKGMQGYERLLAMFPDNEPEIRNLFRAGQILADATKKNTSRSDISRAAREDTQVAEALATGAFEKILSFFGSAGVLQMTARSMDLNRGYRRAPQPINLGRTRRVQERTRIPAVVGTAVYGDEE